MATIYALYYRPPGDIMRRSKFTFRKMSRARAAAKATAKSIKGKSVIVNQKTGRDVLECQPNGSCRVPK